MSEWSRKEAAEYYANVPSPCFVLSDKKIRANGRIMADIQSRTGCKILVALKAFACKDVFPLMREYTHGACASGPYEAQLAHDAFGGEVHVAAPAYSDQDIDVLLRVADHIVFNTPAQWQRFRERVITAERPITCGLRVNPEYAEVSTALYNPCVRYSRLGTTNTECDRTQLDGITGLHVHALCEQGADVLVNMVDALEQKFADLFPQMSWINLGGGHHISRNNYDRDLLCRVIDGLRDRYGFEEIYLEPGEAHVLDAGVLVATVLDIMRNEKDIAILDTSATAHMPDVLEMPYRPHIIGSAMPGERAHTYLLGGMTCLAGDVIGEYSFSEPLVPGDRLIFTDMAHYSFVKTTMFNGVHHPAVAREKEDGDFSLIKKYDYTDYYSRMP